MLCLALSPFHVHAENDPPPLLHPMFQTHAVLQRDAPIRLYGRAAPGEAVRIELASHEAQTRADAEGRWDAQLPALPAGGPHVLIAHSGGRSQTVSDVLIGDVWLCSGQSNMVLQLHRSLDARAEIAGADNDRIRVLTVGETGSIRPLPEFATAVQWQPASAATAAEFSATCFFFARELQKTVDVPMGLVVAAWGGSRIQAWTSAEGLATLGDLDAELAVLAAYAEDPAAGTARWGALWEAWWQRRVEPDGSAADLPWQLDYSDEAARGWADAPAGLGAWERWPVPALARYDGMLWYRTRVQLTAAQAAQPAVLELGAVDEVDMTWVNGRAVGSTYGPGEGRRYALPSGLLRAGENVIALNVLDTYRDGGLAGPEQAHALVLEDGTRVVLDGGWRWRAAPGPDSPPRAPWHTAAGLATLYNGMIAPIGGYGFRGVLWYQGESNTFEAAAYEHLLAALISDWRRRFNAELPWLNVQLAGYGPAPTQPAESGWAQLREVQRRHAERSARYGFASAVDIGDRYDIHPPNKQELGRRLAWLARHLVYGESGLSPSGPQPVSAQREGDVVVVTFTDITDALVAYGAEQPIGFELCEAAAESADDANSSPVCRYASASIDGNSVRLRAANAGAASRVRHGWADSPIITLFDGAGLPAQPFELPITADTPGG
jgi:sialate O-acetylesterase